jgi:hypothetical protein
MTAHRTCVSEHCDRLEGDTRRRHVLPRRTCLSALDIYELSEAIPSADFCGFGGYADAQKETTGVLEWCVGMHVERIWSGS